MNLTRAPGETWLDALLRVAREVGKEDAAYSAYEWLCRGGDNEREAAAGALKACGLVELADEVEVRSHG